MRGCSLASVPRAGGRRTPLKDDEGLFVHEDIERDADKEIRIVETILTEAQRAQRTREDKPGK